MSTPRADTIALAEFIGEAIARAHLRKAQRPGVTSTEALLFPRADEAQDERTKHAQFTRSTEPQAN